MPPFLANLSKNKIIFLGVCAVLLVAVIIGASMLGSWETKVKTKAPKELTIWVVGDETAGFSDIITGFQARYPEYKNTEIKFTKSGNYADYEKALLAVISDGNSPDIFVVNSNGGGLLESKIVAIPGNVINSDEFSKNFNKVFDDLVIEDKQKDDSGKEKTITGIKWVPLGYQALWVFYNWKLIKTVPHLWSEIGNTNNVSSGDEEGETVSSSSSDNDYADMILGLDGRYITGASDILSLFLLQQNISSYLKFSEDAAGKAILSYFSFSGKTSPETFAHLAGTMKDLNLTTTDLFVRGKIGMIVWFPSLLHDIEYAVKRAGTENVLTAPMLRTSEIPQASNDPKESMNLGEYNYFALSKTSKNPSIGYAFLAYLSSREAEEKYLSYFPFYLPAQRIFDEPKMNESISKDYTRVKYRSFMNPDSDLRPFDKGLKTEYNNYFFGTLGNIEKPPKEMLSGAAKYIDCNKKHLIDFTSLEVECKIE